MGSAREQVDATRQKRIAIVHDWLIGGGAELVVEQLHELYPEAPIYTSYATKEWRDRLDGKVITGYLQQWPFSKLRKFIPLLRAIWFSNLNLSDYDLVISSSGAEAKFIKVNRKKLLSKLFAERGDGENRKGDVSENTSSANRSQQQSYADESFSRVLSSAQKQAETVRRQVHIAYIHAPTHYYWSRYNEYLKNPGFPTGLNWLARLGLKLLVGPMRRWDYKAAQRPDHIVANSSHTKSEIKKYYGRDSVVINPPVDIDRFAKYAKPLSERKGFVITGRQTPYKRIDLAVTACTKLNLPLTVIGDGPKNRKLKKLAGPTIHFAGYRSGKEVAELLGSAQAFIFPGLDDFGIAPVEALAACTPVIAFQGGGALDYVIEGKNGLFFSQQTIESLAGALQKFNTADYPPDDIKKSVDKFSNDNFREQINSFIKSIS